jgi:phage regulator Rha-like protein
MSEATTVEKLIYIIRGHKVMLDSDLAELYGVETKVLNQAVKRNPNRFPAEFMFQCDSGGLEDLRSQIVTANALNTWNHKRRSPPMVFTEYGVTMLCSVLNSERAVQVNIAIVKAFIKMRKHLEKDDPLRTELKEFKEETSAWLKIVFQRLD